MHTQVYPTHSIRNKHAQGQHRRLRNRNMYVYGAAQAAVEQSRPGIAQSAVKQTRKGAAHRYPWGQGRMLQNTFVQGKHVGFVETTRLRAAQTAVEQIGIGATQASVEQIRIWGHTG